MAATNIWNYSRLVSTKTVLKLVIQFFVIITILFQYEVLHEMLYLFIYFFLEPKWGTYIVFVCKYILRSELYAN